MRRAHLEEEGQAVVELALVLPLFLLVLLGILQVGFVLNTKQQLADVARVGARTLALTGDATRTSAAVALAARDLPPARSSGGGAFRAASAYTITVGSADGRSSRTLDPSRVRLGDPRRGEWVTVTVAYPYRNPIQATVGGFRLPAIITLTVSATARMEADPNAPTPGREAER